MSAKKCTTHFHGCDCREAEYKRVRAEKEVLRKILGTVYIHWMEGTAPEEVALFTVELQDVLASSAMNTSDAEIMKS